MSTRIGDRAGRHVPLHELQQGCDHEQPHRAYPKLRQPVAARCHSDSHGEHRHHEHQDHAR